ncbi:hypothetical protein [Burkholderia pseudomallei]|uniref:hypothetical protein n=1 Tax=Burkholderia pseudomallei TaxID=28450 RepID=UPI001178B7AB|nr:hypothetical protein [Burkholderia pseudomallei]
MKRNGQLEALIVRTLAESESSYLSNDEIVKLIATDGAEHERATVAHHVLLLEDSGFVKPHGTAWRLTASGHDLYESFMRVKG